MISFPSQPRNFQLSASVKFSMILIIFLTDLSGEKIVLPSRILSMYGRIMSVSTVPGWRSTQVAFLDSRPSSRDYLKPKRRKANLRDIPQGQKDAEFPRSWRANPIDQRLSQRAEMLTTIIVIAWFFLYVYVASSTTRNAIWKIGYLQNWDAPNW